MLKSLFVCLLFIGLSAQLLAQQEPLTSQYNFIPLAYNPSYAGINNVTNFSFNSRFQWNKIEGGPQTNIFTGSTSLVNGAVGLGLLVMNDQLGITNNTTVQFSGSYKISTSTQTFSFGLQAGLVDYRQNFEKLNLSVADDPLFAPGSERATKFNLGAGATYMDEKMFISISVPRLIKNKGGDNNVTVLSERHFYLTGAYLFDIDLGVKLKPSVLLRWVPGSPMSYDLNLSALLNNNLWLGAFTRNFNTYGLMVQYDFMDAYRIGYAFEMLNKSFSGSFVPTHEIMLSADLALFAHQAIYRRFF